MPTYYYMRHKNEAAFTLIELMIVIAIIAIIAAIAIPNLLRARANANEASAISALRTLVSSQARFFQSDVEGDDNYDYATTLEELADTNLIDSVLGEGEKSGYHFSLEAEDEGVEWEAYAIPNEIEGRSQRSFYVDESGVIRFRNCVCEDEEEENCCENEIESDNESVSGTSFAKQRSTKKGISTKLRTLKFYEKNCLFSTYYRRAKRKLPRARLKRKTYKRCGVKPKKINAKSSRTSNSINTLSARISDDISTQEFYTPRKTFTAARCSYFTECPYSEMATELVTSLTSSILLKLDELDGSVDNEINSDAISVLSSGVLIDIAEEVKLELSIYGESFISMLDVELPISTNWIDERLSELRNNLNISEPSTTRTATTKNQTDTKVYTIDYDPSSESHQAAARALQSTPGW